MADSSSVGVLTNIFTAPPAAFAAIKERPNPWLPLLDLDRRHLRRAVHLHAVVDFAVAHGSAARNRPAAGITEEQRRETVDAMTQIPPTVLGAAQGGSAAIAILIVYALIALYYTGVSFATHDGIKYEQWLALIAWCSLPARVRR